MLTWGEIKRMVEETPNAGRQGELITDDTRLSFITIVGTSVSLGVVGQTGWFVIDDGFEIIRRWNQQKESRPDAEQSAHTLPATAAATVPLSASPQGSSLPLIVAPAEASVPLGFVKIHE